MTKFFPSILIVLDVLAAVVYVWDGDWRHSGYWVSAALITFFATF